MTVRLGDPQSWVDAMTEARRLKEAGTLDWSTLVRLFGGSAFVAAGQLDFWESET